MNDTRYKILKQKKREGYTQTYAEMGNTLKNKISHRALATNKLCNFLSK